MGCLGEKGQFAHSLHFRQNTSESVRLALVSCYCAVNELGAGTCKRMHPSE